VTETFRLGRIAGVRVGVNLSVLVIVAIITVGLALGRFPALYPDRPGWAYLLAAAVAAVLFLVSLLAHEVAHAVVAQRNGIEVDGITLWLLGGVARLKGEPRSPGADLRIAGVGPLVSLLLSVAFGVLAGAAGQAGVEGLPFAVLVYLSGINLILAVFNLVPAAPLDGGRLLRAFLWWRKGDQQAAGVTAARAGRVFGFFLIAFGALQVVAGAGLGGLWLALIGLFVVNAATAEEQQARLGSTLRGRRVGEAMSPRPVTADGDQTVDRFLHEVVLTSRHSTYPLVDADGRLTGLVTFNRLREVAPSERSTTRLRDVACPSAEVPTAREEEPLLELFPRLADCSDGRAVVVDGHGRVVGLLSPSDISRAVQHAELGLDPRASRLQGADVSTPHR
jgi:Zn-dependent protease/CBS domain-containing protein